MLDGTSLPYGGVHEELLETLRAPRARRRRLPDAGATSASALGRGRRLRWGAADEEVDGPLPGADLIEGAKRGATMRAGSQCFTLNAQGNSLAARATE